MNDTSPIPACGNCVFYKHLAIGAGVCGDTSKMSTVIDTVTGEQVGVKSVTKKHYHCHNHIPKTNTK